MWQGGAITFQNRWDSGDRTRSLLCAFKHIRWICLSGRRTPFTLSASRFLPAVFLLIILLMQKQPLIMTWRHGLGASTLGVITIIYPCSVDGDQPATHPDCHFDLLPISNFHGHHSCLHGLGLVRACENHWCAYSVFGACLTLGVQFENWTPLALS